MGKYILRRFLFLILTLILTSMIVFSVTQIVPGDVASVILGREAGEAALEAFREENGLNDPLIQQYGRWLFNFVQGEWGTSVAFQRPVRPIVLQRLRASMTLTGLTLLFSVPLAILLGVVAGLKENKLADHIISVTSLAVAGLPEFITGVILVGIFSRWLDILPATSSIRAGDSFLESFPKLILPAITATLVLLAYIARLTRAGVVEELKQGYVRTAVLKGLPRSTVIVKHVLRNALLPTITVIAISFGWLISGLIVIENVFNYPGLGRLLAFAIDRRDLPLMQAITMITVLGFAGANLIADILYAYLNPRIRLQ